MKGKKIEVLLRNTKHRTGNKNPFYVNIDGKTIISKEENAKENYIIIALTILCVLYSLWQMKKRLNEETPTANR